GFAGLGALDLGDERVAGFPVANDLRVIVLWILEHRRLAVDLREREFRSGPGVGVRDVDESSRPFFDPEEFEGDHPAASDSAAHAEHGAAIRRRPPLLDLSLAERALPHAGDPGDV